MNYEKTAAGSPFNVDPAQRVPTLLTGRTVNTIRTNETVFVFEHQRRQFKRNPIVVPLVPEIFASSHP